MASSWRYGKRTKYRTKVSQDPEDFYCLDTKKSIATNAYDIYTALCARNTRDTKRLFLLNALATLCEKQHEQQLNSSSKETSSTSNAAFHQTHQQVNGFGFSVEELLLCLSASLIHIFTQVRAAALRTIRYVLVEPRDVKTFNSMQLPHLVCRSIDIMLKNDDERVQALKLVRKVLAIAPFDLSPAIVRCLVALADAGIEDGDNLLRACLATLCECAVLNPTILITCGGVTSITRNVLECHNPRIAESLCGVLLYLLECPYTRNISNVRLDCLAAPYCDFTYRLGTMDKNKVVRELRYTSCRLALLSVLRSWTGTIEFCDPSKPSALKAIVDALYLNQMEMRKAILDLLFELLELPQPACTEDYTVALQMVDPSDFQDTWLLTNGFVAAEGRSILPSLATRAPNICAQHLALQLYCFLETGLLNALVEVVVGSDVQMSIRATVLIGKLLQLIHTHLPADICSTSSSLPTLIAQATNGNINACAAITALQNYQKLLRKRPAACSLFLDSIIKAQGQTLLGDQSTATLTGSQLPSSFYFNNTIGSTFASTLDRQRLDSVSSSDDSQSQSSSRRSSFRIKRKLLPFLDNLRVHSLIKSSNVLSINDANGWDWEVVITILRSSLIRKLDDMTGKFLKLLVNYFKPSSNRFSHQDLLPGNSAADYVIAGLDLIDWLLASNEFESLRLLTDFFSDVSQHLLAVTTNRAHDCLFSPQHMNNTMCQYYFLFIGRMCRMQKGIVVLNNTAVFEHLINLVRNSDHVCYVKLIVSGLDYILESVTRKVLERALTSSKTRSGRLYATQFLMVLLRARILNFEVWGIPLIIQQTKDADRAVCLAAMEVLEEACHEKYYLEEIVSLWPNLKPMGDVGRLLMARFYSLSRGLNHSKAKVKEEIEYWMQGYCKRYVLLVEADTHASLTLHVRNEDGCYSRRNCNTRPVNEPPNIPPHLYGQLVQTTQGTTALRKYGDLPELMDIVNRSKCTDTKECLDLKAAVWAIGHASTHDNGMEYLNELNSRIFEKIILLVTKCEIYSIRATAYHVLGIISGTNAGANALFKLNWLSVRHERNTIWPVHQPEDWISNNYTPVRHHYDDVPPYNYSGIEDQIDGSSYNGSYWNLLLNSSSANSKKVVNTACSSEIADNNRLMEDSIFLGKSTAAGSTLNRDLSVPCAKSRTLPESIGIRHGRHQRSLSESKTTDMISLNWNSSSTTGSMAHHQHRVRYNSYTDSNTSGVSSCESVTGRVAVTSEIQQFPLSPIPSLSNLMELPRKDKELFRRTSLIGTSYLQNTISPLDIKGYAQLRSLRRHCRPVLSESATDLYDIIDRSDVTPYGSFRMRNSSFGESQRRLKVCSLDRHASLRIFSQADVEKLYQVSLPNTKTGTKYLSSNDSNGPCYAGICLPKNLLEIFPQRNLSSTYVLHHVQDQDLMDLNVLMAKQQCLNDSLNMEGGDESSVVSSLSDVSSISKRSKWLGAKHGRNSCLHCSRSRRSRAQAQHADNEYNSTSIVTAAACDIYSSTSAILVAGGLQPNLAMPKKSTAKQAQQQQQQPVSALTITEPTTASTHLPDISFNSPESILSGESMPDRLAANILYNVQRLANPVSAKQAKLFLLELKQKHAVAFQDICLYSEVCKTLGRSTYRMSARRFLQELFLDLNMDSFYSDPLEILSKKDCKMVELEMQKDNINQHETADESSRKYNTKSTKLNETQSDAETKDSKQQLTTKSLLTNNNNAVAINMCGSYKTALCKLQPLASVYESSCENLLQEQSMHCNLKSQTDCNGCADKIKDTEAANKSTSKTGHLNSGTAENENRKYRRGRFYTLELDLSCTKNKFPITDRSRPNFRRTSSGSETTEQHSLINTELHEAKKDAENLSKNANCNLNNFKMTEKGDITASSKYTITKSLAASMVKPIGSLYCEKRLLHTAKSEGILLNTDSTKTLGNSTSGVG